MLFTFINNCKSKLLKSYYKANQGQSDKRLETIHKITATCYFIQIQTSNNPS